MEKNEKHWEGGEGRELGEENWEGGGEWRFAIPDKNNEQPKASIN